MGKCYPTFCAKKDIPLTYFLCLSFYSFVTSRQHVFLLFPQVSEHLGGLKVSLIADFCMFYAVNFPPQNAQNLNQNHFFFAILYLHCVEEQNSAYAVDCCQGASFYVKKSKFSLIFLHCIFWLELTKHFLIEN